MSASSKLFQPIDVGTVKLKHRVVLAPLTRCRATKTGHIPVVPLVKKYYSQRGSTPGTLLITEATFISPRAGGYNNVPGIWSKDQIKAWREITDSVHSNKSFIFLQLWAIGRAAYPEVLEADSLPFTAPSPIKLSTRKPDSPIPRELTKPEILEFVQLYATAAKNAIFEAGFDGVEIHGANGYLVDQFLQDVSNERTDEYGGSVEARSKFGLEVVKAIVAAVGAERTAIRLNPWGRFQDMKMDDPVPQFTHFVSSLATLYPQLAYLHVVEPPPESDRNVESNDFIREIWSPRPLISVLNYNRETAIKTAEEKGDLIAFGKLFIANPDLPVRLLKDIPLTSPNPATFYTPGDKPGAEIGYIDYPFMEEGIEAHGWL